VSELKREAALREVSVKAVPVNDEDDLDALLGGSLLEEETIAEIANMLSSLNEFDNVELSDDWLVEAHENTGIQTSNISILIAERDRLQKELEDLRSQHEFECEYVDQLEKEVISITHDRDRQVTELTGQLEQLQCQNTALDISQQTLTEELEATQLLLKESTKTIEIAQTKLSEVRSQRDQFEEELIKHLSSQAQLHQSLRGLENEYVSDLTRVQELEQQIEELQNHVLQQASKASEYEAAIHHWKEQSVRHQHHALQLSGALERLLAERPVRHLTPTSAQPSVDIYPEQELLLERELIAESRPLRSPHPHAAANAKVDLPSFLVRHR
jgi:chromosome segregation ATPase